MSSAPASYVVKAKVRDPGAKTFTFLRMKTMYGGKGIASGDEVFVFASEIQAGEGLIARGRVTRVEAAPRKRGLARQTPRVSIKVERIATAKRRFGRTELKPFRGMDEHGPEAELDFKFFRQATNKIGGISEAARRLLCGFL